MFPERERETERKNRRRVCERERERSFTLSCYSPSGCMSLPTSEVREATGIFFVVVRDEEDGLFEIIVAEFLKGDSSCDCGEHRDV